MAIAIDPNKTKIAKRVIEIFEYFGPGRPTATVMDIVRRYGRPQSSTSELLAGLVEMGLLYKEPATRAYSPTPRLAAMGSVAQPDLLRGGNLYAFMDQLAVSTRFGVGLFGMVGTHAQVFRWSPGADRLSARIDTGASELLSASAVGALLLSTLHLEKARKLLWRLNAEAGEERRFDYAAAIQRVIDCSRDSIATGVSGFVADAELTAVLLPRRADERPLAIGVLYPADAAVDAGALAATLRHGIARGVENQSLELPQIPATLMRAV